VSNQAFAALRGRIEAAREGGAFDVTAALSELERIEARNRLLELVSRNGAEQLERGVRELSLLARLAEVFTAPLDLRRTGEALLRAVADAVPCDHAILHHVSSAGDLDALATAGPLATADAFAIADQVARSCIREAKVLRVPDVLEDVRFHDTAHRSRVRSILAAPLRGSEAAIGALVLSSPRPDDFSREQTLVLTPICDVMGAVLSHARLAEEDAERRVRLEQRVVERTRELQAARAALTRQERNAALGRLAASIAHEVNNPMSFLVANLRQAIRYSRDVRAALPVLVELLDSVLRLPASSDARIEKVRAIAARAWYVTLGTGVAAAATEFDSLLHEAEEGATRVQRVGEDLRGFAQGIGGIVELVDLNRLVEAALDVVGTELKGVVFERRLGSLPEVPCQRYEITQLLLTLLQCVVGDASGDVCVRVSTRQVREQVEVEIACGEDAEGSDFGAVLLDEVSFDVFDDRGLGITLAQDIVAAHEGSIEAAADGRALTLRLPIDGSVGRRQQGVADTPRAS